MQSIDTLKTIKDTLLNEGHLRKIQEFTQETASNTAFCFCALKCRNVSVMNFCTEHGNRTLFFFGKSINTKRKVFVRIEQ